MSQINNNNIELVYTPSNNPQNNIPENQPVNQLTRPVLHTTISIHLYYNHNQYHYHRYRNV
jgi:hypothetical protein